MYQCSVISRANYPKAILPMEEFKRLRTFIKAVEAGSFSAAVRDISTVSSVSSIARQVRSLEDELGVRLMNRNTRRLSLTEPGQRLYESATRLLREFDKVQSELVSMHEQVKGLLRISLRVSLGMSIVVPALPKFIERYPELTIDLKLTDERIDLIANNIDVAVWLGPMADSDLVSKKLLPTRRIICGSDSYFARRGRPTEPEDLGDHDCLLFAAANYTDTWGLQKDGTYQEIAVKGPIIADNGLVLVSCMKDGLGLAIIPEWMVRRELEEGSIIRVMDDYTVSPHPSHADLHVVYSSSRAMSRKIRVFVDFLVETFNSVK